MTRLDKALAEKRKAIAGVFLSVLYGLALQEMISPVRAAFRSPEFGIGDVAILVIFVLTVVRFFIGAQLYLWDDKVARQQGTTWLFNFTVLITQGILFAFLGGLASRTASAASPLGFIGLLSWILAVDIVWILIVAGFTYFGPGRSQFWATTPWQWAVLNTALIILTAIATKVLGAGTDALLVSLLVANVAAFLTDVWLVDHCGLIAPDK